MKFYFNEVMGHVLGDSSATSYEVQQSPRVFRLVIADTDAQKDVTISFSEDQTFAEIGRTFAAVAKKLGDGI